MVDNDIADRGKNTLVNPEVHKPPSWTATMTSSLFLTLQTKMLKINQYRVQLLPKIRYGLWILSKIQTSVIMMYQYDNY